MERILIIGCAGAGKSTLARRLGQVLGLPVVHLDKIFWRPGWVEVPQEEFDRLLAEALKQGRWIMDGNFNRTLPQRLAHCDGVIYLDFNRFVCLGSVLKRLLTNVGKVRPDMGEGCPERVDLAFLKWIWNFNKNKRQQYYTMLRDVRHARVIILRNRRQVKGFLKSIAPEGDL